jgi:serine/threonine protein kinase
LYLLFWLYFPQELRDLVRRLLVRSTGRRLGCTSGSATEVKQHPWFKGFDWDALTQRKMKAPYVPKVNGPADASNFDAAQTTPSASRNSRYISTGVFKDF